jgi:hypothetical protein
MSSLSTLAMSEVTITLRPETERRLKLYADREGVTLQEYVENAVEALAGSRKASETATPEKPLWERIVEMWEDVPSEELAKLPPDASVNLDHYLYGAPKVEG